MLIECTVVIPALMVIVFSGHRQPRLNKGTSSSFMSGGGSWKLRHTPGQGLVRIILGQQTLSCQTLAMYGGYARGWVINSRVQPACRRGVWVTPEVPINASLSRLIWLA